LGHLRRHRHEPHVSGALPPAPSGHTLPNWATPTPCPLPRAANSAFFLCHISVPRVSLCRVPLWTRQAATAFDQLLSFDTSSVTSMHQMFTVRFRLRLLHTRSRAGPHARRVCAPNSASLCVPSPLCHTYFPLCHMPARQNAVAFNQPLSFDTSVVTDMSFMFNVRFRLRVLPTLPSWAARTPRTLLIRPSLCVPSPLCHTHFPLHPDASFLDSAECECFQSAAEL